uniref:Zinc finger, CCHC-type n=1 Tax=Tanacetum cinerariifolium TaxID=118510 RepID=A0A6L2J8K9_TANCI|nr:zinc finger, CCHC-type [Tanacetum cinerariifolium]
METWQAEKSATKRREETGGSILFGLPGSRQQKFLVLRFLTSGAARYRPVKFLEFFDCPGPRQGVEDLREHKGSKQVGLKHIGSKQVGFKQRGHKQVEFKQLGPGVKTRFHRVQDEKRVWFEVELHGAQGDREAEVFQVSNDDTAVAQRRLEDKQLENKTNTDCLVKKLKKEHLGIKVRENIRVTGVPGQEGAKGNVAEKKKVMESMKANIRKLLKYNVRLTMRPRFEVPGLDEDGEYRLCLSVSPKVEIVVY